MEHLHSVFTLDINISISSILIPLTSYDIQIISIQTYYVAVEQKTRQPLQTETSEEHYSFQEHHPAASTGSSYQNPAMMYSSQSYNPQQAGRKGNPLRRARIVITVRKTEDYRIWLEKNGTDMVNHGDEDDDE